MSYKIISLNLFIKKINQKHCNYFVMLVLIEVRFIPSLDFNKREMYIILRKITKFCVINYYFSAKNVIYTKYYWHKKFSLIPYMIDFYILDYNSHYLIDGSIQIILDENLILVLPTVFDYLYSSNKSSNKFLNVGER